MYKYGMRLRGFAPFCQPMNGFVKAEEDINGKYHNILFYDRMLSDTELKEYELDYLGGD